MSPYSFFRDMMMTTTYSLYYRRILKAREQEHLGAVAAGDAAMMGGGEIKDAEEEGRRRRKTRRTRMMLRRQQEQEEGRREVPGEQATAALGASMQRGEDVQPQHQQSAPADHHHVINMPLVAGGVLGLASLPPGAAAAESSCHMTTTPGSGNSIDSRQGRYRLMDRQHFLASAHADYVLELSSQTQDPIILTNDPEQVFSAFSNISAFEPLSPTPPVVEEGHEEEELKIEGSDSDDGEKDEEAAMRESGLGFASAGAAEEEEEENEQNTEEREEGDDDNINDDPSLLSQTGEGRGGGEEAQVEDDGEEEGLEVEEVEGKRDSWKYHYERGDSTAISRYDLRASTPFTPGR